MPEENLELVLSESKEAMEKSLHSLLHELTRIRTGRANPLLLERVLVNYYNTPTPLNKLATVNAPEPRLLTVQPFDAGTIPEIEKAILKSDLGLSPINDGKLLRIPVPELTEERRRDLVKQVKKMAEDHKIGVRGARRDGISMMKDLEKDGDLTEDESRHGQRLVQEQTDDYTSKIDAAITAKEEEILRI
jgi:ribosome recycling factor